MNCEYFGKCGSCTLGLMSYEQQLQLKINTQKSRFKDLYENEFDIVKSENEAFRNRAEFRVWRTYDENNNMKLNYAMNDINKKALPIESCSIASKSIAILMPKLIDLISIEDQLSFKLFSIEFLSSTTNDILVSLIYHKKLDQDWIDLAKQLELNLNIKIIGRSRKQKVVCSVDYIDEVLNIDKKDFRFRYYEGGFTQPNQKVNIKMIEWVLKNSKHDADLCELYCGGGNFTIPLSTKFNKILATEISKTSIKSAKQNCELNNINNIQFIRMSSEEFVQAREKVREFRRMAEVDLDSYNFSTIFVDPPRAGLDDTTTQLAKQFNQIIYISCNPQTLYRDLQNLTNTHHIEKFALFDQFAYTQHIECGVILTKSS
jgi:tRNA (uracil-5-)-methyltransferase